MPAQKLKKFFVVLHEDNEAQIEAALDYAEIQLSYAEITEDNDIEFEIYLQGEGTNLFCPKKSCVSERLTEVFAEYPSLKVFASKDQKEQLYSQVQFIESCQDQIRKRREEDWFEFEVHQAGD